MQSPASGQSRNCVRNRKEFGPVFILQQPLGQTAAHQDEDGVGRQTVGVDAFAVGEADEETRARERRQEEEEAVVDVIWNEKFVFRSYYPLTLSLEQKKTK